MELTTNMLIYSVAEPGIEMSRVEHISSNFFKAPKEAYATKQLVQKDSIFVIHEVQLPTTVKDIKTTV